MKLLSDGRAHVIWTQPAVPAAQKYPVPMHLMCSPDHDKFIGKYVNAEGFLLPCQHYHSLTIAFPQLSYKVQRKAVPRYLVYYFLCNVKVSNVLRP